MKLPLTYYGNPILRQKGAPVNEITDEIRQLVSNMIETMHESKGVGIAAPQVNKSLALFITYPPVQQEDESWEQETISVFINPKILNYSEDCDIREEGCLSIPGLCGEVIRPLKITVEATDLEGNHFTKDFFDYEARVIMHENDHINGTLFIDRMDKKARRKLEPKLRAIKTKYHQK